MFGLKGLRLTIKRKFMDYPKLRKKGLIKALVWKRAPNRLRPLVWRLKVMSGAVVFKSFKFV